MLAPLAEGWDGAVPVLPLADTVKRVRGDEVVETLDRSDLVTVQTPQAFLADWPARPRSAAISPARPTARRSSRKPAAGSPPYRATAGC